MNSENLKNVNLKTVDRSTLVDRSRIRLNPNLSHQDRLRDYVRQIKNPYCYLDGKTVVKITFSETETTLEDCIVHYIRGL